MLNEVLTRKDIETEYKNTIKNIEKRKRLVSWIGGIPAVVLLASSIVYGKISKPRNPLVSKYVEITTSLDHLKRSKLIIQNLDDKFKEDNQLPSLDAIISSIEQEKIQLENKPEVKAYQNFNNKSWYLLATGFLALVGTIGYNLHTTKLKSRARYMRNKKELKLARKEYRAKISK